MTSNPNKATIRDAAEEADRKAWEAQMLLREEQQPPEQPVDCDGVVAHDVAARLSAQAAEMAAFFDKDTFTAEHSTPSTGAIWNINKAGDYTKPNVDNLVSWMKNGSGEHFLSTNQGREVFIWRAGCYVPGTEGYIRTLLEVVNDGVGVIPTHVNHTVHRIGSSSIVDSSKLDREWSDLTILNNCVLNTKTGEITPHTPDLYVFSKIVCDHEVGATCPVWQEFLDYALPDKNDQKTLQEMFGAILKRNYNDQVAFFLLGAGGNGKGAVLRVIRALLGAGAASAVPLQQVENRFHNADLHGKYANISGDTSPAALMDASMYKMLTGGDLIRAEYKGKDAFEFMNHATIVNSMNELPPTKDQTDGFFRRFVLIRFDVTPTQERILDKTGFEKAIADNELQGILNWAIEGLKRLNNQGGFTFQINKKVEDLRKVWNVEANHIEAFVSACCVTGASAKQYVATEVFMSAYRRWHEELYGVPPKEQQSDITKAAPWPGFAKPGTARVRTADAGIWLNDDGRERTAINAYKGIYLKSTSGFSDVDLVYVAEHWHEITGLVSAQPPEQPPEQPVDGVLVTDMRAALDKAFELAQDKHIKGVSARDVYQAHPKGLGESIISEILDNDQTMLGLIKKDGLYHRRG